jgi:hypothetical protein
MKDKCTTGYETHYYCPDENCEFHKDTKNQGPKTRDKLEELRHQIWCLVNVADDNLKPADLRERLLRILDNTK